MIKLISSIVTDVLTALYQPFWFALLLSVFFMFFYLYSYDTKEAGNGWKKSLYAFLNYFRGYSAFRKRFFLIFYTAMILCRTLINRDMWPNPLSDVMGKWWIYSTDIATGEVQLNTECLENLMLFIPFTVLLMWYLNYDKKPRQILWNSTKIVFLFSLSIEFLQLFLRLGTFQLSDLFYNTLGGFLGGVIYLIGHKLRKK